MQALTHASHSNEAGDRHAGNERLEFLGDAVLRLVVAEQPDERAAGRRRGHAHATRAPPR